MRTSPLLCLTLCASFLLALPAARAHGRRDDGRVILSFRYRSDPSVPTMPPPAHCLGAPFAANGYVEGPLTAYVHNPWTGRSFEIPFLELGYGKACLQITDFTFTPFLAPVKIYWEIEIYGLGSLKGDGECRPASNDVPEPGIVLGGCVVRLTETPGGFVGGTLIENAVLFNPFGVPGYELSSATHTFYLFRE